MDQKSQRMWRSIHYRVGSNGAPLDPRAKAQLVEILESKDTKAESQSLLRINDDIAVEIRSRSPSEASSVTSDGDEDEWEDVEPDKEILTYKSLQDGKRFNSIAEMCRYDNEQWGIDLVGMRRALGKTVEKPSFQSSEANWTG